MIESGIARSRIPGAAQLGTGLSPPPLRVRVREGGLKENFIEAVTNSKKKPPTRSASRIDLPLKGGGVSEALHRIRET